MTIWSTTPSWPPSQASENLSKLSTHDTGMRRKSLLQNPNFWETLEQVRQKSDSSKSDKFGKGSSQSKQNNNNLALPRARAQLWTEEVHHSWSSSKFGKDGKLTPKEHQWHLDNKRCLFCSTADTSPRTSKIQLGFLHKPKCPSLIWTSPHLLAQTQNKTEQSLRLWWPEDCNWTPSCKKLYFQWHLSFIWLTTLSLTSDTLLDMVLKSLVDSGSSDSFINSVFVQTQQSSGLWHSTYQAPTHWWNLQFCHLTGTRLANPFSYWGIPEPDFLNHSIWPELHNCTRYRWLTHYNPSIDWVLGSLFFWQLSQHKSELTSLWDTFHHQHHFWNFQTLSQDILNNVCHTPQKPLR